MLNTFSLYKLRIRVQVLLVFLSNFYEFPPKLLIIIINFMDSAPIMNLIIFMTKFFISAFIAIHPNATTQQGKTFLPVGLWPPTSRRGEESTAVALPPDAPIHRKVQRRQQKRCNGGSHLFVITQTYCLWCWTSRAAFPSRGNQYLPRNHSGCAGGSRFVTGAPAGQHSPTLGFKLGWEWIHCRPLQLPLGSQVLHSTKETGKS